MGSGPIFSAFDFFKNPFVSHYPGQIHYTETPTTKARFVPSRPLERVTASTVALAAGLAYLPCVLPLCIPVDGPMRQDHLLGLDGHCQRCHERLGPAPLAVPPEPLLVDRVEPRRAPEVLRHEIQVAPAILEPRAAPPAPAPPVEEQGQALTDEELTQHRAEARKAVRVFLGVTGKSADAEDVRYGLVLHVGRLVGFKPEDIADFAELPRAFCREAVGRLRAAGIVAGTWLSDVAFDRLLEDAAKAEGKRGRGGHKGDGLPFCVRFALYTLVAEGACEHDLANDTFRMRP